MTRITHKTIQESTLANLQVNLGALAKLQEQLSTGKKINRPSDDPTGTVAALKVRQELRQTEQFARNADDGIGWLGTVDTALRESSTRLQRARTLTVQALNSGVHSPESRQAIAVEVAGIKDAVLALANTKYLGRNVFAGTSGPEPTFDSASYAFTASAGTGGAVMRSVDDGDPVRVDVDGTAVFGSGTSSVFALLDDLATKIANGTVSGSDLTALDARITNVLTGAADAGARYNRVQGAQQAAADAKLALTTQLSDVDSIDLPETIVQLQLQQTAYQAALGATAKVLQPSLMDFLR